MGESDQGIGREAGMTPGVREFAGPAQATVISLERPLTDSELEQKFKALAQWGGCSERAQPLISLLWSLDAAPDAAAMTRMTARA